MMQESADLKEKPAGFFVALIRSADRFPDLSILQKSPKADRGSSDIRLALKSGKTELLSIRSEATAARAR